MNKHLFFFRGDGEQVLFLKKNIKKHPRHSHCKIKGYAMNIKRYYVHFNAKTQLAKRDKHT